MRSMQETIPQTVYANFLRETAEITKEILKSVPPEEVRKMQAFKMLPHETMMAGAGPYASPMGTRRAKWAPEAESDDRVEKARELIRGMTQRHVDRLVKAGVTSQLGYNFYDLRGPAYLIYPVQTPFRNSMGRTGRVNDGVGTAAHWMATRNFGTQYGGVLEGQRNAIATPDNNPYVATYKEIGVERGVTFTAQFAGEGYTDEVADEHIRGLHELWLQEESLILNGNSGTGSGNNGFQLGQADTPDSLIKAGGALVTSKYYGVYVIELTALGNPNNAQYGYQAAPSVASGVTPNFTRTNQDGSQVTLNGGMGAISDPSDNVQVSGGNLSVLFSLATPQKGATAWAWFLDQEDTDVHNPANAKLAAITTVPEFLAVAVAAGTQTADATDLDVDSSAQPSDFDGLLTYAAKVGLWTNQLGASFTSGEDGSIVEIDQDLQTLWEDFQAQPQTIWAAADAKVAFDKAVRSGGTAPSGYRFDYARDSQNNLLGGYVVSAYQSKFSIDRNGGNALPVRIHPMLPPGTIFYDVEQNPYPHSRIPWVRSLLVQRDYYSIEWPIVTRQWTFGTYCHEVLGHTIPWLSAVRTGIGPFSS